MTLPTAHQEREYGKFRDSANGPAVAVTNPDGSPISGSSGGTSMVDDSPFTVGGSSVTPVGYLADDIATDPLNEGDIGAPRLNATTRIAYAELRDNSGAVVNVALDSSVGTVNTRIGDLTETAPATDTASSGLNGRLQRIAQRLTSLLAVIPSALTAGGNFKTAIQESITLLVTPTPATSGGLSVSKTISAATTNATSVKASAGQVYGWYIGNTNASPRYVKLYDKSTAPTVGTDTPKMTIMLPGGGAANVEFAHGIPFTNGIAFAMVTGMADNDATAVAANELVLNLMYK